MKSPMLVLLLLINGAFFFQPTHQYRLVKRELTEYDLTSFIVSTCSTSKIDVPIQSLCDHTLQSAVMGYFPFLTFYCKTIGAGMSYCKSVNRHMIIHQNTAVKRFVYRRFVRSVNENSKLHRKRQEMDSETDLEQKLILQMCVTKTSSVDTNQFCNRTLHDVQRGRYPAIKRFCKYHPGSNYCQRVRSDSSRFSWPLPEPPSLSSSSSSTDSSTPKISPSFVLSSVFKPSDIKSIINPQRINNPQQQFSTS